MNPKFNFPHVFIPLCLLTLLFVTGCSSTGTSTLSQPVSVKLSRFKNATVEVKSSVTNAPERLDEFMVQLESRIIAKLRERKAFERIYSQAETDSHSDLRITVTFTRVRDVGNFSRLMWGALAGQAKTEATIELREQATGNLIGSGQIEGTSSNGSIFAGTTPQAVDRVADQVVDLVEKNL